MPSRTYWIGGRRSKTSIRIPDEDRYSTCCNIFHIKTGTALLGIVELIAIGALFNQLVRQLRWKNKDLNSCIASKWKDCVLFHFSHFNLTLISDYLIALLLGVLVFCVLLLFYGILVTQAKYLRAHLIVQAVGMLLSLAYFVLYGWSYFYGDLYTQKRKFVMGYFVERMWLSTLLLVFFLFQCYLFVVVVRCSLYLNVMRLERNVKKMQFEDVSERVRQAKENGLWRSTSWGGGFQTYKGQHEKEMQGGERHRDSRRRVDRSVKWDLERNVENSPSNGLDSSSSSNRGEGKGGASEAMQGIGEGVHPNASSTIPIMLSSDPVNISLTRSWDTTADPGVRTLTAQQRHGVAQIRCRPLVDGVHCEESVDMLEIPIEPHTGMSILKTETHV